jgi:hypothetical protein
MKLFTHCYLSTGHFLLIELLLPVLSDQSRVIFLSSAAHFLTIDRWLDLKSACIFDKGAPGHQQDFRVTLKQSYAYIVV